MGRGNRVAALLLLLLPLQALALSLGDLVVHSLPGNPLRAHIPFTLLPGETLTEVRVTLASAEVYRERAIPRPPVLQGLRLALLDRGEGSGRLQLFGEQPWQGEAAQILLQVSWPQGQFERNYRLAAVAPHEAAPLYVEVAPDETLDEIAIRLSRGSNRSYLHMMYALFLANPEAFYRGNMNNLKSGSRLRVPSSEELYRLSNQQVFDGIRDQFEQWQQLREDGGGRGSQAGEALAGMSEAQMAGLDISGDSAALQQRLQEVAAQSEAVRRENEALRERLQSLERRMQAMAGQVLEYAEQEVLPPSRTAEPASAEAVAAPSQATAPPQSEAAEKGETGEKEEPGEEPLLGDSAMFAAIVLAVLFVIYILYSTGHPHRWRN